VKEDASDTGPEVVLDLIIGFRRSKTMFAAVRLGVFDALASGPASLDVLHKSVKYSEKAESAPPRVDRDALERLLDACVGIGLLSRSRGLYQNTPTAEKYLCTKSAYRLTGYINCSNDFFWKLWGDLESAIQEGTNRWKKTFGWDEFYWDCLFRSEADKREFLIGMHGYGQITSPAVVRAFDLTGYKHLVDLGGGTGHLAIAACEAYPGLRATVFDLAEAMPLAAEIIGDTDPKIQERIKLQYGDFFDESKPLPEGDLYVLARTLHDWNEDKIRFLLERVAERLSSNNPPDGALLIAEKLLFDDRSGPVWALMQSLNMLVLTEGKERTLGEYKTLLRDAGFTSVEARRLRADDGGHLMELPLDAILAIKK
jgi:acetylserotonin N-methyltransferase